MVQKQFLKNMLLGFTVIFSAVTLALSYGALSSDALQESTGSTTGSLPSPAVWKAPDYSIATVASKKSLALALRKVNVAKHLAERYNQPYSLVHEYVNLAWAESGKNALVTPELLLAIMQKESSFRHQVSSSYGAQGLMQIVPRWHPEKITKGESLYDPTVNIRVGAEIMQEYLISSNGNHRVALKKYSGNAKNYADFVLRETQNLQDI